LKQKNDVGDFTPALLLTLKSNHGDESNTDWHQWCNEGQHHRVGPLTGGTPSQHLQDCQRKRRHGKCKSSLWRANWKICCRQEFEICPMPLVSILWTLIWRTGVKKWPFPAMKPLEK